MADDGGGFAVELRALPLSPSPALPVTSLALLPRARFSRFYYHVFILKLPKKQNNEQRRHEAPQQQLARSD